MLIKFRGRFDFSSHPYEIGHSVFRNKKLEDNFFIDRLYELASDEHKAFYNFHLAHYLVRNPEGEEKFFLKVDKTMNRRIGFYSANNPSAWGYSSIIDKLSTLDTFREFLDTIDLWSVNTSIEKIFRQKDDEIEMLIGKVKDLQSKLDDIMKYEASEKIAIHGGELPVFMDLMHQVKGLVLPNGNRLLTTQGFSPWYKMIAKNFVHGEKPIPLATAQNYFSSPGSLKYIFIAEKDRGFDIVPVRPEVQNSH
ncbi:hypothetical protein ASE74_20650 [Pedobacter sp. Leaf216]|uniref:hypothetical protein n=1 Tax=Pedobacter sp. Leaf216 TaxID=1735684 RepID=UPI000700FB8C|nr:hypothetical protein [Pedobacter sp. Leaf216]KQM75232.1 hypothetical protein ASE74_20650 [Pedobacter sp. Leaf216]